MIKTNYPITWCPGCPNFMIKRAVEQALINLIKQGYKKEDFVSVTAIGCNAKMYDYLDISGFYGLHGRVLPTAFGIYVGNPKLKVIGFAGDGGTYNEGISHFVHAARYNHDMTFIVHNNQEFSLTTGQASATSEEGFVEKTHPFGVKEKPINPIILALEMGASFVARVSALDLQQMTEVIEKAIKHPGFAFIDILQPCIIYHDNTKILRENCYKIEPMPLNEAIAEARKWNYSCSESKIAVGIFYQEKKPTFVEKYKR